MSGLLQGIQFISAGSGAPAKDKKRDKKKNRHGASARREPDWIHPGLEKRMGGGNASSSTHTNSHEKKDSKKKVSSKKKKKKTHSSKRKSSKHTHSSEGSASSGSDSDDQKGARSAPLSALARDDWMGMSFEPSQAEPTPVEKSEEEQRAEAKAKKLQDEIDAGIREPVTGMLFGFYDPKNPDRRLGDVTADSNSNNNNDRAASQSADEDRDDMPAFGDGGASWRAKMLQRAKQKARESGRPLEEIIQERFGSLDMLQESTRGSARLNAHLHYKRLNREGTGGYGEAAPSGEKQRSTSRDDDRGRRSLQIGRDASDRVVLAKFSSRVQTAVSRTLDEKETSSRDTHQRPGRHTTVARSKNTNEDGADDTEEAPIDYSKLPDFENRPGARFRAAHDGESHGNRGRDRDRGRDPHPRSNETHQRSRSRSRSRNRRLSPTRSGGGREVVSRDRTSGSRRQRSRSRSRSKLATQPAAKKRAPSISEESAEPRPVKRRMPREESAADAEQQREELLKRQAFLYGSRPSVVASGNPIVSADAEISSTSSVSNKITAATSNTTVSAPTKDDEEDLNKLAAKALRAQMMGNTKLFHSLKERLNELEARRDQAQSAQSVPHYEAINGALPPLEKEDLRYGSRKGKKRRSENDNVVENPAAVNPKPVESDAAKRAAVNELVRQERVSSARLGGRGADDDGDMDMTHARNIIRLGTRYKGTEVNAQVLSSGFDEEDQVDMTMLTRPDANLTRRAAAERAQQKFVGETKKWEARTSKCAACMTSPAFKKHLMLSLGEATYLTLPNQQAGLHPAHCFIVPIEHSPSFTQASEQAWEEKVRFQRAVAAMCAVEFDRSVVFVEQTCAAHRQRHTFIECIPVPHDVALDTPLYFKQELLQVDEEWATHKKLLATGGNGGDLKRVVPPQFAYFHIEWPGDGESSSAGGGYAHIIEDETQFPRNFGTNVVAGMLGVDDPRAGRRGRSKKSFDAEKRDVLTFLKHWEGFDWTAELDGGEYDAKQES